MEKRIKIGLCVTITGVVLLLLGTILGWVVLPIVIRAFMRKEGSLQNGTLIYEKWVDIPLPIYLNAYVFHVKNAEDFRDGNWSAKPIFEERGPYVYKEKRVKYEIQSHPERDTISYRQNISYTFVRELSVGPDTDTVAMINAPLLAAATIISTVPEANLPIRHRNFMELLMGPLSGDRFLREHVTVRDALFGVRLNAVYDVILYLLQVLLDFKLPPELQDGMYGPFVNKNASNADGLWEIYSGVKDHDKVNSLRTINGEETVGYQYGGAPIWGTDECNKVRGGDGIFFAPFIEKSDRLMQFANEICGHAWLGFEKETKFRGISTYRFRAKPELFASPNEFAENACYCVTPREPLDPDCAPTGIRRMRSCKSGAPATVSKPHFLDGDPALFRMVDGMKPDRELHDSWADVEPTLGAPMKGARRLQLNMEAQKLPTMGPKFNTIEWRFWPYLWVEESAEIDDALYDELRRKYITPLKIANIGKWVTISLGIIGTLGGGVFLGYFTWWIKKSPKL